MRLRALLLGLCAVQEIACSALYGGVLSEGDLIRTLIEKSNYLPSGSRHVLTERVKAFQLSKRSPQYTDILAGFVTPLVSWISNYGRPQGPVSKVADVHEIASPDFVGAKRKKIRYGPYRVPPTSEKSLESMWLQHQGMASTFQFNAQKPCIGSCLVLKLTSSMEYDDGKPAETNNGAWFHHAVLLNVGANIRDPVCGFSYVENMYMVGNEKSDGRFRVQNSPVKTGYHIEPSDTFVLGTELLNLEDKQKWVWVTLTFDYLDGENTDYLDGKIVWTTIGSYLTMCQSDRQLAAQFGPTNITANNEPIKEVFSENSVPWIVSQDGQLIGTTGHMHDGATSMDVFHNGTKICTQVPKYGNTSGGGMTGTSTSESVAKSHGRRQTVKGGPQSNLEIEHIESQPPCIYNPPVTIKKGDRMYVRANYDFKVHPGMKKADGDLDTVMAIAGSVMALPYPRR